MPKQPPKRTKTARKRGPKDGITPTQAKIIDLVRQHPELNQSQIAKIADVDHSTVSVTLARYGVDTGQVETFKRHRADVLAGLQAKILASITSEDVKKSPFASRIMAVGILYDKERIERGLSDQGTAPLVVIQIRSDRATIATNQPVSPSIMLPPSQEVIDVT
jgi:DNA-binding CsgD family transcriptional regulator